MRRIIAFAVLVASALIAAASGGEAIDLCRVTDAQFLEQLKSMTTWKAIYSVYKRSFPACADDGFFAEGYSDVIVVTLARHWSDLRDLQAITARDPAFERFVLMHIDATTDETDLSQVERNARANCLANAGRLCAGIGERAAAALKELR